ncbi:hypothetical protein [Wolbachia pipientis]|uniref:hypothetical protein n=1 Tax=Wolbachia pipientis TaxID=955 RepID=UPI0025A468EA|nr:hypothetical protein [Wolbachia pipientis]MDM8335483.1 hypothetical protein [Wolbachia pipientis]
MAVSFLKNDSLMKAWGRGYNDSDEGLRNTTKGIVNANCQYVCNHPYKTTAAFIAIAAVTLPTAAYFLDRAYAVLLIRQQNQLMPA